MNSRESSRFPKKSNGFVDSEDENRHTHGLFPEGEDEGGNTNTEHPFH
jgi:hypothetical protein